MATLSVWEFATAGGADRAEAVLQNLQKQELIRVHDAAVVTWAEGARRPKTRQLHSLAGAGALGGAFWGFLFGLIFLVPLLGMAIGAATGALSGSLRDVGINDDFIRDIREQVTPGTSALFVLTSHEVTDKVLHAFEGEDMKLVHTNLSDADEAALRSAFSDE
jgi:uncharacterized membrane protein